MGKGKHNPPLSEITEKLTGYVREYKKINNELKKKGVIKEEISNEEVRIIYKSRLNEFFTKNPITEKFASIENSHSKFLDIVKNKFYGKKVASGEKSCSNILNTVKNKLFSFKERVFPKIDEKFDKDLGEVVNSINSVYVTDAVDQYHYSSISTKDIRESTKKEFPPFLLLSLLAGGLSYFAFKTEANIIYNVAAPIVPFLLFNGIGLKMTNGYVKKNINNLEKATEKTDKFLRKHYVKYKKIGESYKKS